MTIKVWLDPCTINSRKVLAGLQLMGLKYDFQKVDFFKGEQKSDWFTKVNPYQTIPAATEDDLTITESNAILMYAADQAGNDSAYPKDLKLRALVNRWLLWEAASWFQCCYVYLVEFVVKPLSGNTPDQSVVDAESPKFHKYAAILETQLSKTKFLVGDHATIADISVASSMHLHAAQRLPLDLYPNLTRWIKEVEKLEAWRNTQDAVTKALLPNPPHSVRTTVNYTHDVSPELTELYFYPDARAKSIHEPGDAAVEIRVTDGWPERDHFTLDTAGFSLHSFSTPFTAWSDDAAVRDTFYPSIAAFLTRTLGASRVLVFDHTTRTAANTRKALTDEHHTTQRAPVHLVHCDYTAESGPARVRQLLPDEADALLARRVAFVNVWKPLRHAVESSPLAMCDARSCASADLHKLHLRYRERSGENYVLRHAERHRWWYFPRMAPEWVVLLKTFESEGDGRARFVGHTAFEDPESGEGARVRESMEIRTMVFW